METSALEASPLGKFVMITGTITINTGRFSKVTPIELESSGSHSVKGKTLTFHFSDAGDIDGLRFTTPAASRVTFTLSISGRPAAASQIYLGSAQAPASTGSPLTFTR